MKNLLLLILLMFITNAFSQEKRFEEVYQECIYNELPDNGKNLKKYIKGFEEHLISLKILKNNSEKSYLELFKTLTEDKRYPSEYAYSYIDSINKLEISILPSNRKCITKAMKHKSYANYHSRFFNKEQNELLKNLDDNSLKRILKITYDGIRESDYKLDFYKHRLFMILYTINDDFKDFEDEE